MSIKKHVHLLKNKFECDKIYSYESKNHYTILYVWNDRDYFILSSSKEDKAKKLSIKHLEGVKKELKPYLVETFNF